MRIPPLAAENERSNRLGGAPRLFGGSHALADRQKGAIVDLPKINRRRLGAKTLEPFPIAPMPVDDELEASNHLKDLQRAFQDGRQLQDFGVQDLQCSYAVVILASGKSFSHDERIGLQKNMPASKATLTVVQGLGFWV